MAQKELLVLLKIKDDASKQLAKLQKDLEANTKHFKTIGLGAMAAGGAIVAGLGAATKAAAEEQVGINRLSQQLKNVGVDYNQVRDSLEGVISATQRKTAIADDEQRVALGDLITVTGDYQKALDLLPLALDLAASKQMDVSTAAELVGRVAEGNIGILGRYGIEMDKGATSSEALAKLQDRVKGSAEAAADPIKKMENSMSDLSEAVGKALLPHLDKFTKKAVEIIDKVSAWADKNPQLADTLFKVGLALVGAGGVLFAISQVSKAIVALNAALAIMQALTGPKGWITLAAGVAAAGAAIWGMNALMNSASENTPNYEYGGVVPGAIGQPRLAVVHGGERYLGSAGRGGGGGQTVNVVVNVGGSIVSNQELTSYIRQEILKIKTRNTSTGF